MKRIIKETSKNHDSNDVWWEHKGVKVGYGYQAKDDKTFGLIRCPECMKENYGLAVSSGVCSWCGFNANP